MADSSRPPGPDIASTNASPGMISVDSARRLHGRSAGWALSRIAHAGELARRHMALFGDIAGALPIVSLRTDAGTEDDAGASDAADAPPLARKATDAPVAEGQVNSLDDSLGDAMALATPLQRRAAGAGVVRPWMPWSTGREPAGLSLRPGLRDRLAARDAASSEAMQAPGQSDGRRANRGSLQWRAATAARATGHGETLASDRPSMPSAVAVSVHAAAVSELPRSMPSVATLARRIMSDGAAAPGGQAGSMPRGLPSPSPTTAVVSSPSGMSAGGALSLAWGPAGKLSGSGEGAAVKASELLRPTSDPYAIASSVAHIGPPALPASAAQRDAVARSIAVRAEMPSRQDDGSAARVDRQTDDPRRDALAPVSLVRTPSAAGPMGLRLARRDPAAQPTSDLAPGVAVHRHRQANRPVREGSQPAVTVTRPTQAAYGAAGGAPEAGPLPLATTMPGAPLSPIVSRRDETSTPHHGDHEAAAVSPVAAASDGAKVAGTAWSGEGEPPRIAIAPLVRVDAATPISRMVAHRASLRLPLLVARKLDSGDAPAGSAAPVANAAATFDCTAPAMARVNEASRAAAVPDLPTLVWRAVPDSLATASASARSSDQAGTMLMRSTAEALTAMTPAAPITAPAAPGDMAAHALDIHHLAERVTGLIARRLEIECERRGGRRWA
jgi:hypothetical protein